jgi:hypothetical protein
MISDRVMRGPNVIRFDRYTYLGKVGRVACTTATVPCYNDTAAYR